MADEQYSVHAECDDVAQSHYLKLIFTTENAAYYQFPVFPPLNEAWVTGAARKREGKIQHIRVDLVGISLENYLSTLEGNYHLQKIEPSDEETFVKAPSNRI